MDDTELTPKQKEQVPAAIKWTETLLITAFSLGFSFWLRPEDPFYLDGNFPWLVIGPLLVAMRYGFFAAFTSALLIIAALGFHQRLALQAGQAFPYVWALGVLGVSLLAGEFRDNWDRQRAKLEASNHYRQTRLEEFTRNYYLLKVSHDRLDQQLAGSPSSLREALRRLNAQMNDVSQPGLNSDSAALMLSLLVRYGQIQSAGIYQVHNGHIDAEPLASIGRFEPVKPDDPLLLHALAERKLVSIQTEFRRRLSELDTDLLAAIPLIDSEDHFIGVCLIETMPFFSFEARSLRLLAILAGHMADLVHQQPQTNARVSPDTSAFRHQLARVGRDAEQFSLPAALVALNFAESQNGQLISDNVHRERRGLDVILEQQQNCRRRLLILMPLTDELGMASYLQRLDDGLRENLGIDTSELSPPITLMINNQQIAYDWVERMLSGSEDATACALTG